MSKEFQNLEEDIVDMNTISQQIWKYRIKYYKNFINFTMWSYWLYQSARAPDLKAMNFPI